MINTHLTKIKVFLFFFQTKYECFPKSIGTFTNLQCSNLRKKLFGKILPAKLNSSNFASRDCTSSISPSISKTTNYKLHCHDFWITLKNVNSVSILLSCYWVHYLVYNKKLQNVRTYQIFLAT